MGKVVLSFGMPLLGRLFEPFRSLDQIFCYPLTFIVAGPLDGMSFTYAIFADGTDIYWARQQASERLASVRDQMPALVEGGLAPISTPLSDVLMFTVEGPLDLVAKRTLLDWTIRPALRTLLPLSRTPAGPCA